MWSKGPFKSRRTIGNPTSADKTSEKPVVYADPTRAGKCAKGLPALPNDSAASLHNEPSAPAAPRPASRHSDESKRYANVSPAVSPELGPRPRDSGSSFCVSPIDESETGRALRHRRMGSGGSGIAAPPPDATDTKLSPPESSEPAPKTVLFAPHRQEQPPRGDAYADEPTESNAGKTGPVEPRNANFQKSSGSHASNFLHWGREQLQPKRKFEQARHRLSSFSKHEPRAQMDSRNRSSPRVFPLAEQSGNRDASPQPQINLGFVPTVVTTITAGQPRPLSERLATEDTYTGPRREEIHPKFDTGIDSAMRSERLLSRFGALNAAMGTGSANGSPNDSPRASLTLDSKSTDDLPSSIMSRQRPLPSMPTSKKPVRKPTPLEAAQEPTLAHLPLPDDAPKDAVGRIESLETRRDELAKRRVNLETVIYELTRVIQPDAIAYDLAAKAEVKRSVQSIENEIAEIKREEHELGMKVTRAWRRLDEQENNGDGSNLWVKRVTS
ncbi:uncharacterized protein N7482_003495 [Penicillium canariense]|uniref:Uncharacterized protein n=1 Tax=Penicillium canariense TaxID=189055 RepID=A0A9W9I4S5_9EURO|nr:uncharacterized protein N7482_003495 [Penicillium canariense]KAJ5167901.1 hypothetical protein N7482_003495 [Penicillium canariense]